MTLIDFNPKPKYLKNQSKPRLWWENAKAAIAVIVFISSLLLADYIDKL